MAALAALLSLGCVAAAPADEASIATIKVSSAASGGSVGRLVEGVMSFRGNDYLLTLHGVAQSATAVGSVRGLVRARDIAGVYRSSDEGLRNAMGVSIRFEPPLVLSGDQLEIELSSRRNPKVSGGHRESGVE